MPAIDLLKLVLLLAVTPLVACSRGKPAPAELRAGEDACAACRMAVSEAQFASQRVRRGAVPAFFDDLGCLRRSVRERPLEADAAVYVMDFESGRWIDAFTAHYVHAAEVRTPMGSGLFAFGDRERAGAAAARYHGRVLDWSELLAPPGDAAPRTAGHRGGGAP